MAAGFTDWESPINISKQDLGYVSMRPVYGGVSYALHTGNITPSDMHTIGSITGKGMLLGGFITLKPAQSQASDYCQVTIDDNTFIASALTYCDARGLTKMYTDVLYLLKFDDTNYIYTFGISYGYTFDSSVLIEYRETLGNTFAVSVKVFFSLF